MDNFIPVSLPSKCLAYDGVLPDSVKIRTLKGKDERFIAELSSENFDKKLNVIFKDVVQGISPEDLTIGDRLYVLVWEAINSYSPLYPVEFVCSFCGQKVLVDVDLSKLEVKELPSSYKEPYELKLSGGTLIKVRLLRVSDEIKVGEVEKTGGNVWLYRYALSLVDDRDAWTRVNWLEGLNTRDIAIIRAFHEKFYHGPIMETAYDCPKCGSSGIIPVPFRFEFLLPYGKTLTRYYGDKV